MVFAGNHNNVLDTGEYTFETVLDTAFERLREKHAEYSIRRIDKMDEELQNLEKELDYFIGAC